MGKRKTKARIKKPSATDTLTAEIDLRDKIKIMDQEVMDHFQTMRKLCFAAWNHGVRFAPMDDEQVYVVRDPKTGPGYYHLPATSTWSERQPSVAERELGEMLKSWRAEHQRLVDRVRDLKEDLMTVPDILETVRQLLSERKRRGKK